MELGLRTSQFIVLGASSPRSSISCFWCLRLSCSQIPPSLCPHLVEGAFKQEQNSHHVGPTHMPPPSPERSSITGNEVGT